MRAGKILIPIFLLLAAALPAAAQADSVSLSAQDVGGGQIQVSVTSSVTCSGFCAWFAHADERYSSLPCTDDTTFIRWVGKYHESMTETGATESFNFKPFFPRSTKICVFLNGPGGVTTGEIIIPLPAGYGVQRSAGYNCDDFSSQAAAEYYLYLYSGDPSRLDADHDGSACEDNKCPCGAERIPAEPEPAPIMFEETGTLHKYRAMLPYIGVSHGCRRLTFSAGGRSGWLPFAGDDSPFPGVIKIELQRPGGAASVRRISTERTQPVRWSGLAPGQYRATFRYLGDEWHRASRAKTFMPTVARCQRESTR